MASDVPFSDWPWVQRGGCFGGKSAKAEMQESVGFLGSFCKPSWCLIDGVRKQDRQRHTFGLGDEAEGLPSGSWGSQRRGRLGAGAREFSVGQVGLEGPWIILVGSFRKWPNV